MSPPTRRRVRDGDEEDGSLDAPGETVPAGELSGGLGLAAAGVAVEQDDLVLIEGAIKGAQSR